MPAAKIDSNLTALYAAEETTLGVLPGTPIWRRMEPNGYNAFGADVKTIARNPINPSRQRLKGTIVDLDAVAGFTHDYLTAGLLRWLQGFFFAAARQKSQTQNLAGANIAMTATTATAFNAAAGLTVKARDIVLSEGFGNAANNGIKVASAATGASVTVTGNAVEAAPPATARLTVVGVEFAAADASITAVGTTGIQLNAVAYDLTTLGLTVGEWVYLGADLLANRFVNNNGYARVAAITANAITFNEATWVGATEAGTGKSIRLWFGSFLKNELAPNIVRKTVQFERQLGNDDNGIQSEYVTGAVANELTLNVTLTDKLTVDLGYVGIGSEQRTGTQGVKAGTRVEPIAEGAVNTSSDIFRSRMAIADPTNINNAALVGYIESASIKINNGATPNKAVGKLGAFEVTVGDFMVDADTTAYFSDIRAVQAVRQVADVEYNLIAARANQGFVWDLPLLTAGNGQTNVEKDQAVKVPLTGMGGMSSMGHTLSYTQFHYLPTVAMPAVQ